MSIHANQAATACLFRRQLSLMAVLLASLAGCRSVTSTMVERDASNQSWTREAQFDGVPITLKVPTHIKLYVFEKHFLEFVPGTGGTDRPQVRPIELDVPVRDFAQDFIYTDKIFFVDFKRPAGGAANTRYELSEDQYFTQIQHDITDTTLRDAAGLLAQVLPNGGLFPSPASGESRQKISEIKSLVAVGVFEIASPDLHQQLMNFVNCHFNKSHDAWVVPPGVEAIHRTGLAPGANINWPYPTTPLCQPGEACLCDPGMYPRP